MKKIAAERFLHGFDQETHERLSGDIRAELGRHRITIDALANEMKHHRTTVNMWLNVNVTQERFDKMTHAIERIVKQKGV